MPITLAEAKVGMQDHVDWQVFDLFQRSSFLLDRLTFDNVLSPTGGSNFVYRYTQLKTPSTAQTRQINQEYTADHAVRETKTASPVILGGKFRIDRVLHETSGSIDETAFQFEQKAKAVANEFHNMVINATEEGDGFDGLAAMLAEADTVQQAEADLSTSAEMDANYNHFLDEIDEWLTLLNGTPDMLLMNTKMAAKLRAVARRAGFYTRSTDSFGRAVEAYNGIQFVDAGNYYDGTAQKTVEVVPTTAATESAPGKTDIYAVRFGLDAFHGISPTGTNVVRSFFPDWTTPGAVKDGEVELVAGIVLKDTRSAGVLKGVPVTPKTPKNAPTTGPTTG